MSLAQDSDSTYFGRKVEGIYKVGNDPRSRDQLLSLFHTLWNFAQYWHCNPNDIEFLEGLWIGPRTIIFEVQWIELTNDEWLQVENIAISAHVYSEWTALILRAAETVSLTISRPMRELYIKRIYWYNDERFCVEFDT